jgi:hypothetical protein
MRENAPASGVPIVSSPASTGGAGTFFELHVVAYWLAQLLVRGIPPVLLDSTVVEVHVQTEHLGWHTDDVLVVAENSSGLRRRLIGQVKQTVIISSSNEEFAKTVADFWRDYKGSHFSSDTDRFLLIALRGTNALLEHFAALLESARVATTAAEFERRLGVPGLLNRRAVHYCGEIQTIVGDVVGSSVDAAALWPFLRLLHVLSLDLNTATAQHEAHIKTLLAHTSNAPDAADAAGSSWNELLRFAGAAMPAARSLRRDDLPDILRQRHSGFAGTQDRVLRALHEHSLVVLEGIRTSIGPNCHLVRESLIQQVIAAFGSCQVVLVSGAAGSGKSAVAKRALETLSNDLFAFAFRAEEFAHAHFNGMLQSAQIPATARTLSAVLAAQERKVLLVESVERLLEKPTRDAFADLLRLVRQDASWLVVLTCRDYSTDLVRASFLDATGVGHSVVSIPPLDDGELAEVEATIPLLKRPLADPALRRVLRNPYFLDKAMLIDWASEKSIPQSESAFRALFWQQVVRVSDRPANDMPRRRETAFLQVALRRARALTMYADGRDLDHEAINGLRRDSLLVASTQTETALAAAHDVLEDWAILQWIDEERHGGDVSAKDLSSIIGSHPAVRRTYRKWVGEVVAREPELAYRLFKDAVGDATVPLHFRDDTVVALLRSSAAVDQLKRHGDALFADDNRQLRRVIHLLRVACVTIPPWAETGIGHSSLVHVPDGQAWAGVLSLVRDHLDTFASGDYRLLLGLIEDWSKGATWQTPYPDGAEAVATIAHWLLLRFDDYSHEEERRRTLRIIAAIPNSDPTRFRFLLRGVGDEKRRDRLVRDFRAIVLESLDGAAAARDLPTDLIDAAWDHIAAKDEHLSHEHLGSLLHDDLVFGVAPGLRHDYFPASAYHGPFLPLLRTHPREGLDFVIKLLNHSADWYAHRRVRDEYVDLPLEIALALPNGGSRSQWCDARLWNWYRGSSVGPYVLQSMLMALERWLIELAEARPQQLDKVLLGLLQRSSTGAVTAVVASVATAFPRFAGETILTLLQEPMFILLDRQRVAGESGPRLRPDSPLFAQERREADERPHRARDLENAVANLQLTPLASRVHTLLDRHRAELPPDNEQEELHRIWRLALHRMDLRQYSVADDAEEPIQSADGRQQAAPSQSVRLDLNPPEPDIQAMVEESSTRLRIVNVRLGLQLWGEHVFRREDSAKYDPREWSEKLRAAQAPDVKGSDTEERQLGSGGPGYVAAVCVRDHWEELSDEDRRWCIDVVCSELAKDADSWNQFARSQKYESSADRPAACVVSSLVGHPLPEPQRSRIRKSFLLALTHAVDEVRSQAAAGVGLHLWSMDAALTRRCLDAIATEARLVQQSWAATRKSPYGKRRQLDTIEQEAAATIRNRFDDDSLIQPDAHQALDVGDFIGAEAQLRILMILAHAPGEAITEACFHRAAETLVRWWDSDEARRRKGETRQDRDHDTATATSELLVSFAMQVSNEVAERVLCPVLEAIDRHPDHVHWLIHKVIIAEDRHRNTDHFWFVWQLFAQRIHRARWLTRIDDEHPIGGPMISAVFLGSFWSDHIRHWRSLEGHVQRIHELFEQLPPGSTVLNDYVRFLYQIGEQSLPEAFTRIADRLQAGNADQLLAPQDTILRLEMLLQRYVYGKPLELKRQRALRESVLLLLDLLVDTGSSAAFRMRDDFVTPLPVD